MWLMGKTESERRRKQEKLGKKSRKRKAGKVTRGGSDRAIGSGGKGRDEKTHVRKKGINDRMCTHPAVVTRPVRLSTLKSQLVSSAMAYVILPFSSWSGSNAFTFITLESGAMSSEMVATYLAK